MYGKYSLLYLPGKNCSFSFTEKQKPVETTIKILLTKENFLFGAGSFV